LNKVTTRGSIPCHLVVDKTGKCLVVANYGSGSVAAFPIKPDGSLGEASAFVQHEGSGVNARQKGPHAHMVQLSEDNRFILVPDLGADQVITYRLNPAKGTLTAEPKPTRGAPGLGPRHLAFDPQGKFDYLINEMGSAVTAFRFNSSGGSLTPLQTISTLPKEFTGTNNSAEIEVHPNGKFVYASNRGDDSIAMFSADAKTGTLTLTGRVPTGGKTPRNFAIDPTGGYLLAANQDSGSIITFRIDKNTGDLTPTGEQVSIPQPVCILFMRQR
jgi:6-phosphogluconolactonase